MGALASPDGRSPALGTRELVRNGEQALGGFGAGETPDAHGVNEACPRSLLSERAEV